MKLLFWLLPLCLMMRGNCRSVLLCTLLLLCLLQTPASRSRDYLLHARLLLLLAWLLRHEREGPDADTSRTQRTLQSSHGGR